MDSRRPSKPNLPSVPKPSKLLLQQDSVEPISSLAYRIPLLDHIIYQYEIDLFLTASQSTKQPSHRYGYDEKMFWYCNSQRFNNGKEESRGI